MIDCYKGQNTWNEATMRPLLQRFQQEFEKRQQEEHEKMMASKDENIAAGKKFLEENALNKSVYQTKSGLQYKIERKGKGGKKPTATNKVKVHYTGKLLDGKVFDSSVDRGQPAEFFLNQVIPGWTEGLQLMDIGSKYIFYIPSNLAYGDQVVGSIPPGSTLIFEVELLDILPDKAPQNNGIQVIQR
ncbi:MAG: FKBP-type peptidyl-prolyl cis-trans isomerase [Bacteroidales bacterium]|nr:FKBP-type peptidyl-prolyl cis-trans isomerase [Bacteroidales bacterium]MBR6992163.1 FKBP-type peptidyl-prolyl cis-trans isomerase [Bacteroidales bacterium]